MSHSCSLSVWLLIQCELNITRHNKVRPKNLWLCNGQTGKGWYLKIIVMILPENGQFLYKIYIFLLNTTQAFTAQACCCHIIYMIISLHKMIIIYLINNWIIIHTSPDQWYWSSWETVHYSEIEKWLGTNPLLVWSATHPYMNNHNEQPIVVPDANMIPLWSLTEWINGMTDLIRGNSIKKENMEQEQPGNLTIN